MFRLGRNLSASQGLASWPVLLCLALGVLTPSAALLWFMNRAMQNEQFAVQQKLIDAYRLQVSFHAARIPAFWDGKLEAVREISQKVSAPELFAAVVEQSLADGFIVRNARHGIVYPGTLHMLPSGAGTDTNLNQKALALQAATREARAAGKTNEAREILLQLGGLEFDPAQDAQGRLLAASADLAALELLPRDEARFAEVSARLRRRLSHSNTAMSSPQRRFLMGELAALTGDRTLDPLLAAEQFTARAVAHLDLSMDGVQLHPDLVSFQTNEFVFLFRPSRLKTDLERALHTNASASGIELVVLDRRLTAEKFIAVSPIEGMPGWQLAARPSNPEEFDRLAQQQITLYLWVGILVVSAVTIISLFAARGLVRQMRLTRLKNDLVANVTHELKTPLASTRLLVETLLDSPRVTDGTTREYLELIARENRRLGSLIENFLAFSRMERNKFSFNFEPVPGDQIIEQAADAIREKLSTDTCDFTVECPKELPTVRADADSLATAVINLLENAFKYTGEKKRIVLRGRTKGDRVIFEVQDNGIGIPQREIKKIFRRFYQVDQRLSRTAGGCGLGLSIVDFIVHAHEGEILVESAADRGSTFSISLPMVVETIQREEAAA